MIAYHIRQMWYRVFDWAAEDLMRDQVQKHLDNLVDEQSDMLINGTPPEKCSECPEPSSMFLPTETPTLAILLHPFGTIWSRDLKVIKKLFDLHHKRFKYKRFCRTHGLGFQAKYNASN